MKTTNVSQGLVTAATTPCAELAIQGQTQLESWFKKGTKTTLVVVQGAGVQELQELQERAFHSISVL